MNVNKHHGEFQVTKIPLGDCKKMSSVEYIVEAERWSRGLTRMKSRGPGDTENAMRKIAREYKVDYGLLWKLRYRRDAIKDIGVTAYMKLQAAYQAECQRQMRKLQDDIRATEEITGPNHAWVAEAKALVAEE